MKPNFTEMSLKELRMYVLDHRDDDEAFYAYVDRSKTEENWVRMPPLKSMEDLEDYPKFLEKIGRDGKEYSNRVFIIVNNNDPESGRVFESDTNEILPNSQQWNDPYEGAFTVKSRVLLRSFNDIGYQVVSEWNGAVLKTFSDLSEQESNLLQAEEWLASNGYREVLSE